MALANCVEPHSASADELLIVFLVQEARTARNESSRASRLSVPFNQEATERLRAFRRVAVALGSLHDRALHQDVPGEGEGVGVAQSGLEREAANDGADVLEVAGACAADGVVEVAELEQGVDEGAAFEVVAVEPLVE
jgi:hypothetical protein